MKNIISYNDYIEERYIRSHCIEQDKTANFFYGDKFIEFCKFCNTKMEIVYIDKNEEDCCGLDAWSKTEDVVRKCLSCGWWQYSYTGNDGCEDRIDKEQVRIYKGVVKVFNSDDNKLPISVLNEECKRNPSILYQIGTKKFEEFLQDTFQNLYNCEVIHCGKTGDGGIDLIMINSDEPILVQAKRRTESRSKFAEPIKDIREFLGVMLINNSKNGIYVTTSKKYSKNTEKTIQRINKERIVTKFDIVNFDKLISIFNQNKQIHDEPWNKLIAQGKYYM